MAGARKRKAPEDSSSESDTEGADEDLIYDAMREGESFGVVWRHFRRGCTRSDRVEAYRVIKEVVEADDVQAYYVWGMQTSDLEVLQGAEPPQGEVRRLVPTACRQGHGGSGEELLGGLAQGRGEA